MRYIYRVNDFIYVIEEDPKFHIWHVIRIREGDISFYKDKTYASLEKAQISILQEAEIKNLD